MSRRPPSDFADSPPPEPERARRRSSSRRYCRESTAWFYLLLWKPAQSVITPIAVSAKRRHSHHHSHLLPHENDCEIVIVSTLGMSRLYTLTVAFLNFVRVKASATGVSGCASRA